MGQQGIACRTTLLSAVFNEGALSSQATSPVQATAKSASPRWGRVTGSFRLTRPQDMELNWPVAKEQRI